MLPPHNGIDFPAAPRTLSTSDDASCVLIYDALQKALSMVLEVTAVCRSIKTLFNFEPPATEQEIRAASLQFVRKLSGFNSPSRANQAAFDRAVEKLPQRPVCSSTHWS